MPSVAIAISPIAEDRSDFISLWSDFFDQSTTGLNSGEYIRSTGMICDNTQISYTSSKDLVYELAGMIQELLTEYSLDVTSTIVQPTKDLK